MNEVCVCVCVLVSHRAVMSQGQGRSRRPHYWTVPLSLKPAAVFLGGYILALVLRVWLHHHRRGCRVWDYLLILAISPERLLTFPTYMTWTEAHGEAVFDQTWMDYRIRRSLCSKSLRFFPRLICGSPSGAGFSPEPWRSHQSCEQQLQICILLKLCEQDSRG